VSVDSYFELATTLIGWKIANAIAQVTVASGLIFLPIGVALYRNWSQPMRSQESRNAAPVSLRRMEQDVAIALITIVLFFLPAVPVEPGQIRYDRAFDDIDYTAADKQLPYFENIRRDENFKVPVFWWLTIEISALVTSSVVEAIDWLGKPAGLRPALMRIGKLELNDEAILQELRDFRTDCYEPSLAKYQKNPQQKQPLNLAESVDWLGSHLFLTTPGYYQHCPQVAVCGTSYHSSAVMPTWLSVSSSSVVEPGKPRCDAWWSHTQRGLRAKLLVHLHQEAPWLQGDLDRIAKRKTGSNNVAIARQIIEHEDRFLRRLLSQTPHVLTERADRGKSLYWYSKNLFSIDGIQQLIASGGALIMSAVFHIAMELILIGLPMVQALMFMLVYITLPLVVPYAMVNPSIIIRAILILFSLRFVSALWALAEFLDEKLLQTLYPDASLLEFGGSGSSADIVLSLITLFSYLSLPVGWFLLMGSLGGGVIRSVSQGWTAVGSRPFSAIEGGSRNFIPGVGKK